MKLQRLRVIAPFALAVALCAAPFVVMAQLTPASTGLDTAAAGTGLLDACKGQANAQACLAGLVGKVIGIALGFVEVILFLLFLWAGFLWMTAGGDEAKVKKAKAYMYNAVAGLVIIALSYVISSFVITQLSTVLSK